MKLGIALGGGGAKGLAHIPMLEVIDEFGLPVHQMAGTSIGAIVGVLYASGHSAKEIRDLVSQMTYMEGDGLLRSIKDKYPFRWLQYIDIDWSGNAFLKADSFMADLMGDVRASVFEDLKCQLKVVAADFWQREQVVFESGDIRQAVQASMALPGIFVPMVVDNQVLIDGGAVNPVPFDVLDDCDLVVAVNVMGNRTESAGLIPSFSEAVFNSFQIMQSTILKHKLLAASPDIFIAPDIVNIRMLEFYKAEEVFKQSEPAKELLRRQLDEWLELNKP